MGTTNILDLNNRVDDLERTISGGDSAQANKKDIATEFSATTNYTAGCFVYHEGKLYQFNADHSAGAWDPTDVVGANVTDQVVSNAAAIAGLTASDVAYDNTDSGLTATNVQGAVDELTESYPANKVMMPDGVTSVEDAIDEVKSGLSTLLWTNPNNELAPQTITLTNLQEYRYIDIVHSFSPEAAVRNVSRFKVANGTNNLFCGRIDTSVSSTSVINTLNFASREFTINGNGITFGSGQMTHNNDVYKDWDSRCVPFEIYGVKY